MYKFIIWIYISTSEDDDEDGDDETSALGDNQKEGKIGAKKMRKLQEKAEKKAAREVSSDI